MNLKSINTFSICTIYTDGLLEGGTHLNVGYGHVLPLRPLPDRFPSPPFQKFSVPQDATFACNHIFFEYLNSKASKWGKSSVPKPHIESKPTFCSEIQFSKTPYLAVVHPLAPAFSPKLKLSTPLVLTPSVINLK